MGAIPANIHWGAQTLSVGDVLLVSGTLGDHGATILNLREQLGLGWRAGQRLRSINPAYSAAA
ncbi:hydrogenase isoenzymes formation protein [Citrobacter koseri]|uniref:Hydrogenase isoenzymes formation protein n=1 Tax=Citrobacter koseri TaxID=545 RepID=A0A2X2WPD8_CITKO|nr:hydrogenase isoenzymes formation protein [Citrobacter koseri]